MFFFLFCDWGDTNKDTSNSKEMKKRKFQLDTWNVDWLVRVHTRYSAWLLETFRKLFISHYLNSFSFFLIQTLVYLRDRNDFYCLNQCPRFSRELYQFANFYWSIDCRENEKILVLFWTLSSNHHWSYENEKQLVELVIEYWVWLIQSGVNREQRRRVF